ncbi:chemotaxis protein [Sulfuricella sp. T08]|uniref:methyl-accepting chemotaxis protein n=1 Tax=Sulfuricella sp. T08 TaxID=1632857 RepID=UPI0006179C63|nr:methyl-accepting chemotaxis protein [Sulfuricella sp. T08]GAO37385.1 chemotaxis protein [Sulfuricella sp. T08]
MGEIKDDTADQAADLRRVVMVNEDIKKVIRISSEVNLVALNAMLVAKRSGEKSRGFAVVSSELRVFSRKLEVAMTGLGALIFGLVRDAAAMQKQSRERRHWLNTVAHGGPGADLVAPMLARKEETMGSTGQEIRSDWHKLQIQLGRVLQMCETGGALSRSAKIEAVYGGDMSATLKQVANQIEETVNEIFSTLKLLRTQLAE